MKENQFVPKPKYADVKFEEMPAFIEWLDKTATNKLSFRDMGQDLLTMWIDADGEVLYTELQSSVWCAKFVDVEKIKLKKGITMFINGKWRLMDFIVIKNETLQSVPA